MKIANLLGRGVEYCGVTKCIIEMNKYKNCDNYYIEMKKWGRNAFNKKQFILLKDYNKLNEYDWVFIQSIPPKIKNKDDKNLEEWNKLLNTIETKVAFFNHDHNIISIKRNLGLIETCEKADIIFTLCKENDFVKFINQHNKNFINKLEVFEPMFNFDKKNWKQYEEKNIQLIHWVGRTTTWKRFEDFFLFHNKFNNWTLIMEGLEKSIAFCRVKKFKEIYNDTTLEKNKENIILDKSKINIFGPYKNVELLEKIKSEGFGCQISALKKKYINRNYEYSHCELINSGVVCIFNVEWFKHCIHRKQQIPFTEIKNSGIIWFDKNKVDECVKEIKKVANNKELYNQYRENAFKLWKEHGEAEIIYNNIISTLKSRLCKECDEIKNGDYCDCDD